MKYLIAFLMLVQGLNAYDEFDVCVTFNPVTHTYTVDPSGCRHEPENDIVED